MALRLSIENVPTLPDGGPTSFTVAGKRTVDIGRDQHLDWTLPDPTRFVSGKHCEVHYRDNAYWLHDVSTNGTFFYGVEQRMRSPHRLKDGDRLVIGQYIISVAIDGEPNSDAAAPAVAAKKQHAAYPELWTPDEVAPPPIDPKQIQAPRDRARPINSDFLDWAAAVPEAEKRGNSARLLMDGPPKSSRPIAEDPDMSWASGRPAPRAAPPEPAPKVNPRRPTWKDESDSPAEGGRPLAEREAIQPVQPLPPPRPPVEAVPVTAPVAPVAALQAGVVAGGDKLFLKQLASAAGLPGDFFASRESKQLAEQLGALLRISIDGVMQLLRARNESKRLARSTNQTTIQATENNALKFAPSAEEAMRILFGPKTRSYLDAPGAMTQGFEDLKSHQLRTYMAMQHAISTLLASVDPEKLAQQNNRGPLWTRLRSRKSRLWDELMIRWEATLGKDQASAVQAFMLHFADYYDRHDTGGPR
jgi:type VI secretion system protein ImpI